MEKVNELEVAKDELKDTLSFLVEDKAIDGDSLTIALGDASAKIMRAEREKEKCYSKLLSLNQKIQAIYDKGVGTPPPIVDGLFVEVADAVEARKVDAAIEEPVTVVI